MVITALSIFKAFNDNSLVATVDLTINHCLAIKRIKILDKSDIVFFAMPSKKIPNGTFKDIVFPINQEVRSAIGGLLLAAYGHLQATGKDKLFFSIADMQNIKELELQSIADFAVSDIYMEYPALQSVPMLSLTQIKVFQSHGSKMKAILEMTFDSKIVVRDIKLIEKMDHSMFLAMPSTKNKQGTFDSVVFPIIEPARQHLEHLAKSAYTRLLASGSQRATYMVEGDIQHTSSLKPTEADNIYVPVAFNPAQEPIPGTAAIPRQDEQQNACDTVRETIAETNAGHLERIKQKIFHVLWDASEDGYILQSKITPILQRHGIDWKSEFQVDELKSLIPKLDFMSIRKLEPKPNHFVNWVVLSKNQNNHLVEQSETKESSLFSASKAELHRFLYAATENSNGDMLLSQVVPLLRQKAPHLLEALPSMKISLILRECEFAKLFIVQTDELHVATWVHILPLQEQGTAAAPKQERVLPATTEGGATVEGNWVLSGDAGDTGKLPVHLIDYSPKPVVEKTATGKVIQAQNNPFKHLPNNVFWPEHKVFPDRDGLIRDKYFGKKLTFAQQQGSIGQHELDVLSWVSKLRYIKNTMVIDLVEGGFIAKPDRFEFKADKIGKNLFRLYQCNLLDLYRFCIINEENEILSNNSERIYTLTNFGHNLLRDIGRDSDYNAFVVLQDSNSIMQSLSLNQWYIKWISFFSDHISRHLLNKTMTAKIPIMFGANIHAMVECNSVPIFGQSVRRGPEWGYMYQSGNFTHKIQRVINVICNYTSVYYENQPAQFKNKPIFVFIGEDEEHCREIFEKIKGILYPQGQDQPLITVWFACDLEVYNNFPGSHFMFDYYGALTPVNLYEQLQVQPQAPPLPPQDIDDAPRCSEGDAEELGTAVELSPADTSCEQYAHELPHTQPVDDTLLWEQVDDDPAAFGNDAGESDEADEVPSTAPLEQSYRPPAHIRPTAVALPQQDAGTSDAPKLVDGKAASKRVGKAAPADAVHPAPRPQYARRQDMKRPKPVDTGARPRRKQPPNALQKIAAGIALLHPGSQSQHTPKRAPKYGRNYRQNP